MSTLEEDLRDLEGAEEFLEYFELDFDQDVVHVNRLHILQRFHNYLKKTPLPGDEEAKYAAYREALARAYQDFVNSDAQTEKVFKVFQQGQPQVAFVPLTEIRRA